MKPSQDPIRQTSWPHRPTMIVVLAIAILLIATIASGQSFEDKNDDHGRLLNDASSTEQWDVELIPPPVAEETSEPTPRYIVTSPGLANDGQLPVPLQFDGSSAGSAPADTAFGIAKGSRSVYVRPRGDARPQYAELFASLSNFDADADPDGWRADVILRDRKDRPVIMRASAKFELTPRVFVPRVTSADQWRFANADIAPITWSVPLEFDHRGVASVKLPLRQSLRSKLGWSSVVRPAARGRNYGIHSRYFGSRDNARSFQAQNVRTTNLEDRIGLPSTGQLRVRVSVPSEGVFETVIPVQIRPSVLVDTRWPYQ